MASQSPSADTVSFGEFEANLRSRELRRQGRKVRLPDQAFQVLAMLLERSGELVTREDIQKRLWRADTFVNFDHGLNNAVNRLREALGDSAETPRFIETLPRRGYRFLGTVNGQRRNTFSVVPETASEPSSGVSSAELSKRAWRSLSYAWIAVAVAAIAFGLLATRKFLFVRREPSIPIRSLAVLPLENLSGDPEQDLIQRGE